MTLPTDPLRCVTTIRCRDWAGHPTTLPLTLGYSAHDPYAVRLDFGDTHATAPVVSWLVARDLLMDGLHAEVGEGDVKVRPDEHPALGRLVTIELSSPSGRLVGHASADVVSAFVRWTLSLVPAGTESSMLDHDALVSSLLSGSRRA